MMTKRSNLFHRVILNEAEVVTTDTIYRGRMHAAYDGRAQDLVAGFHNSLTLLLAELEGRTYGGGVLELVPSEISRLAVPMLSTNGHLASFDAVSRSTGGQRDHSETLVARTDAMLTELIPGYGTLVEQLASARIRMQARRQRTS
jgi:hypothetical protein